MAGNVVDFNPLESFHLLFKNLWSMNIAYRLKMNVVDTVLYKDGSPYCWLFTSEQTGEVMKKKDDRLRSAQDIVKAMKAKSRDYTGSKELVMRNKIAIVWYMEPDRKIRSHIVDETELKAIMASRLTEILCIQTYIGGLYFRGNGVYEHRMWTQKDGAVKHITYESANMPRDSLDRFTGDSDRVVISEHQHGALSALAKQLMTHMSFVNKCKVTGIIFQAVFTEGWVPHLIAGKKFTFSDLSFDAEDMKEEMIYPAGRAPAPPAAPTPQAALLLPRSYDDFALRKMSMLPRGGSAPPPASLSAPAPAPVPAAPASGHTPVTTSKHAPSAQFTQPMQSVQPSTTTTVEQQVPPQACSNTAPAPSAPADYDATPTSTQSRKVRSSSLSYHSHSGRYYPNYTTEQARRAEQLSRQVSAKSDRLMQVSVEEAQAMALGDAQGTVGTGLGEMGVSGKLSSKLSSPVRKSVSAKLRGDTPPGKRGYSTEISNGEPATELVETDFGIEEAGVAFTAAPAGAGGGVGTPSTSTTLPDRRRSAAQRQSYSAKVITRSQLNLRYRQASVTATGPVDTSGEDKQRCSAPPEVSEPPAPLRRAVTVAGLTTAASEAAGVRNLQPFSALRPSGEGKGELSVPPIDPSREPSRINYNTEDYYATVHMGAKPSALHQLQASKSVRPATAGVETAALKAGASAKQPGNADGVNTSRKGSTRSVAGGGWQGDTSALAGTARRGTTATTATQLTSTQGRTPPHTGGLDATCAYPPGPGSTPIVRMFRPASATSLSRLHQSQDKVKTAFGASSGQLGTLAVGRTHPGSNNHTDIGYSNKPFRLEPFEITTEVSAQHTSFHRGQLRDDEAALKELQRVLNDRRPISAPHTMRPSKPYVPKELLPPERKQSRQKTRGCDAAQVQARTGVTCFGSYCNFSTRARSAAVNENNRGRRGTGIATVSSTGSGNHSNHLYKPYGASGAITSTTVATQSSNERSKECPYHITYKSILLARAEVKFLGSDIDENIESLLDQIRLSSVSTEQLYTFFVRRHLSRVAQKCQEEGRRMLADTAGPLTAQEQWSEIDLIYRQLVYTDALASIHPSRFYNTVPICEMCYQVYTFMDAQRELAVLCDTDDPDLASATAAASHERAQFSASADAQQAELHQTDSAKRIRIRLGLGDGTTKPHHHTHHQHHEQFHQHMTAQDGDEDPYIQDTTVNTDQFVPHHSAQRDVYENVHKRESYATTLRRNVANLKALSSPDHVSRSGSPDSPGRGSPERAVSRGNLLEGNANSGDEHDEPQQQAQTPPASSRRKVVLERDRVPVNPRADDRLNLTHDAGIGSRGPVMPTSAKHEHSTSGTYQSWVKLLRTPAVTPGGPNAQYDKVHGWRTEEEWDRQGGSPPHLRPTSATVNRLRSHRALQRPHSANSTSTHRTIRSDAGSGRPTSATATATATAAAAAALAPYWDISLRAQESSTEGEGDSTHVKFASGSQLVRSLSRLNMPPAHFADDYTAHHPHSARPMNPALRRQQMEAEVQELQASIRKESRRPHSAGPVPHRRKSGTGVSAKDPSGIRREDSIAALEMELANKMLELTRHLAAHPAPPAPPLQGPADPTQLEWQQDRLNQQTEDDYAYSSLPFMAAPYYPSVHATPEHVADAAYTQLQIDPVQHTVVPPQPTPQQQRQMQLEAERRELEARIAAERARLEADRAAQLAQLQAERVALREQQRLMRSTSGLKPTPSTDLSPVSARKVSRASLTPEHTDGSVIGHGQVHRARSESIDSEPPTRLLRFEDEAGRLELEAEQDAAREQAEELLRLQQQKELRDLQHMQQLLHQRHQQQIMQLQEAQRSHSHRDLSQPEEDTPNAAATTVPAAAWDDLEMSVDDGDYLNNAYAGFPMAGSGGIRNSVEMSPLSPPLFPYLAVGVAASQPTREYFPLDNLPQLPPDLDGMLQTADRGESARTEIYDTAGSLEPSEGDTFRSYGEGRSAVNDGGDPDNHEQAPPPPSDAGDSHDYYEDDRHSTYSVDEANEPSRKHSAPVHQHGPDSGRRSEPAQTATGTASYDSNKSESLHLTQMDRSFPQLNVQCDSPDNAPSSAQHQLPVGLTLAHAPAPPFPQAQSPPARRQSRAKEGYPASAVPSANTHVSNRAARNIAEADQERNPNPSLNPNASGAATGREVGNDDAVNDAMESVALIVQAAPQSRTPHAQKQRHPAEKFTRQSQKVPNEDV